MWIFTKNSFVSVVQYRQKPDRALVRARRRKDLEKLFPGRTNEITHTPEADYAWRIAATKKELAEIMAHYIERYLDYDNFKTAQESDDPEWPQFLGSVWQAGWELQEADAQGQPEPEALD